MKWKTKKRQTPNDREERTRRRFAWHHTAVSSYTVWLEWYEVRERYFRPAHGNPAFWSEYARNILEVMV